MFTFFIQAYYYKVHFFNIISDSFIVYIYCYIYDIFIKYCQLRSAGSINSKSQNSEGDFGEYRFPSKVREGVSEKPVNLLACVL